MNAPFYIGRWDQRKDIRAGLKTAGKAKAGLVGKFATPAAIADQGLKRFVATNKKFDNKRIQTVSENTRKALDWTTGAGAGMMALGGLASFSGIGTAAAPFLLGYGAKLAGYSALAGIGHTLTKSMFGTEQGVPKTETDNIPPVLGGSGDRVDWGQDTGSPPPQVVGGQDKVDSSRFDPYLLPSREEISNKLSGRIGLIVTKSFGNLAAAYMGTPQTDLSGLKDNLNTLMGYRSVLMNPESSQQEMANAVFGYRTAADLETMKLGLNDAYQYANFMQQTQRENLDKLHTLAFQYDKTIADAEGKKARALQDAEGNPAMIAAINEHYNYIGGLYQEKERAIKQARADYTNPKVSGLGIPTYDQTVLARFRSKYQSPGQASLPAEQTEIPASFRGGSIRPEMYARAVELGIQDSPVLNRLVERSGNGREFRRNVLKKEGAWNSIGRDIMGVEMDQRKYNSVNTQFGSNLNQALGGRSLTDLTVGEVVRLQEENRSNGNSAAVGAYQFLPNTLKEMAKHAGIDPKEKFSPEIQERLAQELFVQQGIGAWEGLVKQPRALHSIVNYTSSIIG